MGRSSVMLSRIRWVITITTSLVAILGCSLSPQSAGQKASAPWSPGDVASAITTRNASAQNVEGAKSYDLTVTANCHADEQLVGGGFEAGGVFEYALFLRADYPASNGWTVKTGSISHYGVTVYAFCLRGSPSLETKVISGKECPNESTALSLGMSEQGAVTLCAARHVASVSRATAPITLTATQNGYSPQSGSVACPPGALALDGGSTVGLELASDPANGFAGWEVVTGGDGAGEVFANCVTLA
jgi:hypothetical protein